MNNSSDIVRLFSDLQKLITQQGLDTVVQKLRLMKLDYDNEMRFDICNYIVSVTATQYKVATNDLIYSNKRGLIAEGRRMCFALMKEHLKITDELIGDYFGGRKRQYVNKEMNTLPLNDNKFVTKQDKKFVETFIKLTIDVMRYRNSLSIEEKTTK